MTASSTITASNSSPQTVRTLGQNHERRIAIIGVLPPAQSGVADYTLSTIVELSQLAEVTVFVNELGGLEDPRLQVKKLSAQPFIEDEFDDYIAIIAGNHMHIPAFEYLRYFNMTTISHENRYLELWNYWYGEAGAATELSTKDQPILAKDIARYLNSLDDLPDLGYQRIAKCSATIFVHSTELATRVRQETNHPRVIVDPFVPYNLPSTASIGPEQIRQAAKDAGLKEDNLNIATFGEINIRTKGADVLVHVLSWLKSWNVHPMLHFVGRATDSEQSVLMGLAKDLGVDDLIRWHGRVTKQQMESCLIGMDVGVQLRTSSILNLSGAYADCLVHGTPTVTTEAIANEMGQPAYVTTVNNRVSPFLVAEAIVEIGMRRRNEAKEIEEERLAYIESRNPRKYAEILLKELTNAK